MLKFYLVVLLSLYSTVSVAKDTDVSLLYSVGERNTTVDWNIAGNLQGTNPNIISELTWRDIKSHQLSVGAIWSEDDYFMNALGEYGVVYSGQNQDSDYNSDNRQDEFSRSVNNAGKGYMLDAEVNYGKNFIISPNLKASASFGYSEHRQHLKMYDGTQVIGSADLTGLDSLYQANWKGPQIGLGLNYLHKKNVFLADYTYQDIELNAHTNWNLRSDLQHPVSMTQIGSGNGSKLSVGIERAVSNFSSISLMLSRYNYAASGTHTFHLLSGDASQKLNEVNWQADEIQLVYRSLF
jgi:hypothetical protein